MQYLGFFLIFVALIALAVGVMQHLKMKKILAAGGKKTGAGGARPNLPERFVVRRGGRPLFFFPSWRPPARATGPNSTLSPNAPSTPPYRGAPLTTVARSPGRSASANTALISSAVTAR